MIWNCLLPDAGYMENCLNLFENDPYLGMLVPPIPYHSGYIKLLGNAWTKCLLETQKLAEKLKITADISAFHQPYGLSSCFWARTEALSPVLRQAWTPEDFPEEPLPLDGTINHALERIFPFAAQQAGFYSATIQNSAYASANLSNYSHIISRCLKPLVETQGFNDITEIFGENYYKKRVALLKYIFKNTKKICIYGQGNNGINMAEFLINNDIAFEYFLVSDGLPIERACLNHPAYYLSEKCIDAAKIKVIVSVDKFSNDVVIENLLECGWIDYFVAV
jgi:rhamnosyltransferase